MSTAYCVRVVVSPLLPVGPSLAEDVVRTVRHTMARTLRWLGEDVGPKPGDAVHAYMLPGGVMIASPALAARLCGRAAATVIRYPERAFPLGWEQAPAVDACLHEWESVYVEWRPGDFDELDRCSTCHTPRCDRWDRSTTDPARTRCVERRHHRTVHIYESGEFEPVGGYLHEIDEDA